MCHDRDFAHSITQKRDTRIAAALFSASQRYAIHFYYCRSPPTITHRYLYRRSTSNPDLVTPEWPLPLIDIVVLIRRTQLELIRIEVQPSIQDRHAIRMLNHRATHKCLHDIVIRWNKTRATRSVAVDRHVRLRLQRVDVVDGVLFARCYVHASSVVRSEASLF
jgi:hypothetical protein